MRETIVRFLYVAALAITYAIVYSFGFRQGSKLGATHTHTETVHWQNDSLPIPKAVPGRDCTVVFQQLRYDTTWVWRIQNFRDTVYADCDSATRYTLVHSDTNAKITYTADICGRLLNHSLTVDAYTHTVVLTPVVLPRKDFGLYATANSGGAIGLAGARGRWMFGYQYSPYGPQQWQRHALTLGFRLYPFRP